MLKRINKLLIIMAVICMVFAMILIILTYINKVQVESLAKSTDTIEKNYTTTESNTWDISEAGDGSVIASLSEDGVLTISGIGDMKDYSSYSTRLAPWYSVGAQIKQVKIEEGVTSIGDWAFYECKTLTEIIIPNSVTSVGDYAFYYCGSLKEIAISEGVTSIGDSAFNRCSSLTEIVIPEGVISIGSRAFNGCSSLINIKVDINNTNYCDENGVLYTKDKKEIMNYPAAKQDSIYTILSSVTSIGDSAFYGCSNLKEIIIPNSVTSVGDYAFYACRSLKEIAIPEGVTSIGFGAFWYCANLTEIIIPSSVTSIGTNAFYDCSSLKEIAIPEGVTSIGNNAFYRCSSLTELIIPSSVTSIGSRAFLGCSSLINIKVDINNTNYCDENGVLYTKDKKEIMNYPAAKQDSIYTILSSVTSIGDSAFYGCSNLKEIIIPSSVTSIGSWEFYGCSSLKEIVIPEGVTSIGNYAFYQLSNVIIICKDNTIAKRYAEDKGINYIATEYKIYKGYIKKINPETTYETFRNNIKTNMEYTLKEENGVVTNTGIMKTAQVLIIGDRSYTIIVTGDINGDGKAKLSDLSKLKLSIVGTTRLEGPCKEAADINGDGNVRLSDLSKMKLYLVGKESL